ncbi:MAG: hypothetical protein L6Q83_08755 [Gammaproteobacteria bacterium]|nr:hypothetical protein [Gammaproteobacteria bacterium]
MRTVDEPDELDTSLAAVDQGTSHARPFTAQWLVNRRRIEQATEQRELGRLLADFEDYLV